MHHSQPTNDSKHFPLTVSRSDDEGNWFGVLPEGEILLEPKATPLPMVQACSLSQQPFLFPGKLVSIRVSITPYGIFVTMRAIITPLRL